LEHPAEQGCGEHQLEWVEDELVGDVEDGLAARHVLGERPPGHGGGVADEREEQREVHPDRRTEQGGDARADEDDEGQTERVVAAAVRDLPSDQREHADGGEDDEDANAVAAHLVVDVDDPRSGDGRRSRH
jgi:hypothetical protein